MTSGGLGTMGYGLPAAIGVQIAHPDALVIDIAGEASILMNIQEMSTLAQYRLPVKVFILNNQYMGMVRQWQELLHGGRYSRELLRGRCRISSSWRRRSARVGLRATKPSRARRRDHGDDRAADRPVIVDCRGRPDGELLPDDSVGRGAQRDAAGPGATRRPRRVSDEGMVLV